MSEDKKAGMSKRTFLKSTAVLTAGLALGLGTAEVVGDLKKDHEIPTLENLSDDLMNYKGETSEEYKAILVLALEKALRENGGKIAKGNLRISVNFVDTQGLKTINVYTDKDGFEKAQINFPNGGHKVLDPNQMLNVLSAAKEVATIYIVFGDNVDIDGEKIPGPIKRLAKDVKLEDSKFCERSIQLNLVFFDPNYKLDYKIEKGNYDLLTFRVDDAHAPFYLSLESRRWITNQDDKWISPPDIISVSPKMEVGLKDNLSEVKDAIKTVNSWFDR